ncbi:hypothetical protein HMSSN139_16540 [Paenibacillus sp. HMSSN-139]|nr:hypothetical protein HMSSN139_16540 [Paenibacillus sp. HMSSN-139]
MLNIIKTSSEQQFNETGAGIIASLLQSNPRAILGLATGSTPVGVYEKLIELYKEGSVSFKQASSYNLDEYIGLPADHPESYRRFMDEKLFNHIDIVPKYACAIRKRCGSRASRQGLREAAGRSRSNRFAIAGSRP